MDIYDELDTLRSRQRKIDDGYRLFNDGSIRTMTITDSLEQGWYELAVQVPGSAPILQQYFPCEGYLKTDGMREAIALRDRIIDHVKTCRAKEKDGEQSDQFLGRL